MTKLHSKFRRYPLAATWRRKRNDWHLTAGGHSVAHIIVTEDGWLSVIRDLPDHGWHAVDFHTLKQGKACLERWWATHDTFAAFERYLAPERIRLRCALP